MEDLDTPDRIRVLRIIDQLRDLGVSEDISLPQVNMFELLRAYYCWSFFGSLYSFMRHTGYSMTQIGYELGQSITSYYPAPVV
jgi:hypothetical protein